MKVKGECKSVREARIFLYSVLKFPQAKFRSV